MTIRDKVLASVPWAFLESASSAALGLISMLVLGRFLTPVEFGVAALALALGGYGDLLIGALLTGPLIQRQDLSARALDTAFWMSAALGAAALLLCLLLSAPLARFYGEAELAGCIAALGANSFLTSVSLVPQALLARQLSLRSLTLRALAGRVLAIAATIILAARGYGAWAIVAGTIMGGSCTAILSWSAGFRRPGLQFSRHACAELLSFGWPIAMQELLWSAVNRLFPMLVGIFHGAEALGYLNFATKLVDPVAGILGASAFRLGLPMFAALQQQRGAVGQAFKVASRYTFAFIAPALVGLAALAQDVVPILFGENWRPAIPLVQILALYNAIMFTRVFVAPCLTALGAPHRNLVTAMVSAFVVVLGALATRDAGILVVVLVWAARILVSVPVSAHQMSVVVPVSAAEQFRPFVAPALACAGMFAIVEGARQLVAGLGLASFAVTIPAGIVAYLLLITLFDRSLFTQALAVLRRRAYAGGKPHAL